MSEESMKVKAIIILLLLLLLSDVNPIRAVQPAPEPVQNDMGTGADAGDTFDEATLINVGNSNGYIHDPIDSRDYYKIPVVAGQTIRVDMTSKLDFKCNLAIYDAYEQVVDAAEFSKANSQISVSWTFTSPGFCYITMATWTRQGGTYSLSITLSEEASENEPPDIGDNGFQIPGYPILSVMIGILAGVVFLGFRSRISSPRPFQSARQRVAKLHV